MARTSERELGDLSRLDDGRLAEMFQQRGDDPQFLDALNAELKQRDSDAAFDLHMKVVMARRALVRVAAIGGTPTRGPAIGTGSRLAACVSRRAQAHASG